MASNKKIQKKKTPSKAPVKKRAASKSKGKTPPRNLDQVRTILFGSQIEETERRLGLIEERLGKEIKSVGDKLSKQQKDFETFVRDELRTFQDRLKAESDERSTHHRELTNQVSKFNTRTGKRISKMSESQSKHIADLRKKLREQKKALPELCREIVAEVEEELLASVEGLTVDKIGRRAMAEALAEMAQRIRK